MEAKQKLLIEKKYRGLKLIAIGLVIGFSAFLFNCLVKQLMGDEE